LYSRIWFLRTLVLGFTIKPLIMRALKKIILPGLYITLLLTSCQPDVERKRYTGTYVEMLDEEAILNVVCNSENGPNCDVVLEYLNNQYNKSLLNKFYACYEQNNIAGFIQNESWRQLFPGVPQEEINKVLSGTYKFLVNKRSNSILILRNMNGDYSASNVVYAFKVAS
jgi:hypothetical protein